MKANSKRLIPSFIFVGFIAMLCSCTTLAQNSSLPSWVNNPYNTYSESQYLIGVGSSNNRQGAKNQAQANLAKIFVSKVDVNETLVDEFNENVSSSGRTTTQQNTLLITESDIRSNQKMKNVKIKKVYQADNGTYYALAMMDRLKTSSLYSREIEENNNSIATFRQKAEQADSKLSALIYFKQAYISAKVNKMLINQRAILTGQPGIFENKNYVDVVEAYQKAKDQCTVNLSARDEVPSNVMSAIRRSLQNEGFTISRKNATSPAVKILVHLSVDPVDLNRPNVEFMQWALKIEAQNYESNNWFSTYTAEGREGSMNKQYARKRVQQAVQAMIKSEFADYINDELLSVN